MNFANEILDAIEIMVRQVVEDNTTKIYKGICKSITETNCTLTINGTDNIVKYYGGTPIVGSLYQVFVPFGNMSAAFIIVPGAGGGSSGSVSSVNGKTGDVILNANDVGALSNTTTIPTKTSDITNDSGYITESALDGYAKESDIPTNNNQLTNGAGYITASQVPVKSVDGSTGAVVTNAVKTTAQALTDTQKQQVRLNIGAGTSSFDGDYNSLSNAPSIPTSTSEITNDSGYITSEDVPVKSVNDKTGAVQLSADDVGALPDTTVIPVVNDATLDVQRNGTSVGTFTANASENKTINISVPTQASDIGALPDTTSIPSKTSDLTNDSGYITSAQAPVQSVNNKTGAVTLTQDDIASGATYVQTHNDFTDELKTQISTNQTDIESLEASVAGKQDTITGAATTITNSDLTKSRALVSNTNGKVAVSSVTSTELGYLEGVTSNIQTQLNKKLESAPVTSVNGKTGAVSLTASDVGALPSDTSIPSKTSELTNDSGYITSAGAPVQSVNTKTGSVVLSASDVGAVSTSNITQTLGTSTTKVPSEKAVSDALSSAGAGDMLKSAYDPDGSVDAAGGIPDYVEANGGKIDTIKVNGTAQSIVNKTVDISVPTKTSDITNDSGFITDADIPDNLVGYTAISEVEAVTSLDADTLEGYNAAYFATAADLTTTNSNVSALDTSVTTLESQLANVNTQINNKVDKSGDTMTGVLVAQTNTDYATRQVRNVIISTSEPSGGASGDLWIKYSV